ncbi:phosphate ABC transporter substrate-binding protein [Pseudoalteromonas byunsanensis]|uniref:Phosphate ABC transporter substrate-binding protein n=1 Tax=Pseudoalteromonas byunsanensis TaxID=327939 RepID=A0A1S1N2P9_9GAMM|nr:phosphate ABC transporter substrate-binding protein [Pseudoalteromonas byunsanensis]OHU93585.1 phosphate ABC transporter substrate-binding protein [Pseudoalteromonas byunsanensis]
MKKTIATCILLAASAHCAAEVSVIVHPSNGNTLDKDSIAKIYLGKTKSFNDGTKVQAVSLNSGNVVDEFTSNVLGKSSSQYKAYWSKLIFTGKGTPPEGLDSEQAVLDFVAGNTDAIGYVDSGKVTGAVKVIGKF